MNLSYLVKRGRVGQPCRAPTAVTPVRPSRGLRLAERLVPTHAVSNEEMVVDEVQKVRARAWV